MPTSPTHIMVATPCFEGHMTGIYSNSLLKLQQACFQKQIPLTVKNILGDSLIVRARQNLVAYFMENKDATHLLFIDADIGFEPNQVFRLLEYGKDVTAAAYPVKNLNWRKIVEQVKAGNPRLPSATLDYVVEFADPSNIRIEKDFAQVRAAGTGFLMIRREAIERMVQHYPDLQYSRDLVAQDDLKGSKWRYALFNCMVDKETGVFLSEDYSFCRRWTDMGGEIWLDLNSALTHAGTTYFKGDMASILRPSDKQDGKPS